LGVNNAQKSPSEWFTDLGLDKADIARIWDQLDEALKAADIMALVRSG